MKNTLNKLINITLILNLKNSSLLFSLNSIHGISNRRWVFILIKAYKLKNKIIVITDNMEGAKVIEELKFKSNLDCMYKLK